MSTPVEQIKDRLSIIDVVSSYMELHKAGRHYKGKSPFTNEKTPSFFVSPDRGVYYCFSSGKGGDIFTFIQEMEGVDFRGALRILAERAGVELTPEDPKARTERDTLHAILEEATTYFTRALTAHPDIGAYLKGRGLTQKTIASWRIGYAPEGWRNLKEHLAAQGYSEDMMLRSGLVKRSEEKQTLYDVFRDRAMFPIADASGRVVGFSGRAMHADDTTPKYVNSPETELYEKSEILFGYDKAKQGIRQYDFSLIVEGQFDLVLAHQAGFSNTVAISGTALTDHHAALIERLSKRVVLALDADRAGINSVKRAAQVMLPRGMDVKVARIPEGKDPADLVQAGGDALKEVVREARTVIEFLIEVTKEGARDERAFRLRARDDVLPFVLLLGSRIEREHFAGVVAEAIGTTKDAITYELERLASHAAHSTPAEEPAPAAVPHTQDVSKGVHRRIDELARYLFGILRWQEQLPLSSGEDADTSVQAIDCGELARNLADALGPERWRALEELSEAETQQHVFRAEAYAADLPPHVLSREVSHALAELRERRLRAALAEARQRLFDAERSDDSETVASCLQECADLQKQLGALPHIHATP